MEGNDCMDRARSSPRLAKALCDLADAANAICMCPQCFGSLLMNVALVSLRSDNTPADIILAQVRAALDAVEDAYAERRVH